MQKIVPHLWFDKEAKEAAEFYTNTFPNSSVTHSSTIHDTPSGDADMLAFKLMGYEFMAISAGPLFKCNPSISFLVSCDSKEMVDELWEKLSQNGNVRLPLDAYPYSERYGWIEDKFGVSWQLMYDTTQAPRITPVCTFTEDVCGKAEEAITFYTSVFKDASVGDINRYPENATPDKPGTVMFASFKLEDQDFAAMDSARDHGFTFTEAISFVVKCKTQEEIDHYWGKLSAVPEAEQCGWLKDKFGVSWQIVPTAMDEMMSSGTPEQTQRVTAAFLKMKKFNIAELQKAYDAK